MMISGIGVFVLLVSALAQRRFRAESKSKFKSRTDLQQRISDNASHACGLLPGYRSYCQTKHLNQKSFLMLLEVLN